MIDSYSPVSSRWIVPLRTWDMGWASSATRMASKRRSAAFAGSGVSSASRSARSSTRACFAREHLGRVAGLDPARACMVLPRDPQGVLPREPDPRVLDQGLPDHDPPLGDVRGHHPEPLGLGEQGHRPAAQEGVQERHSGPLGARNQPVDLPEDRGAKAAFSAQVRAARRATWRACGDAGKVAPLPLRTGFLRREADSLCCTGHGAPGRHRRHWSMHKATRPRFGLQEHQVFWSETGSHRLCLLPPPLPGFGHLDLGTLGGDHARDHGGHRPSGRARGVRGLRQGAQPHRALNPDPKGDIP